MTFLAEAGYAVAFVQYRSSAQAHFPAQIIDVKSAIRFLRKNADKYGIDPNRVAVTGRSAGGSLAALAAMNRPELDQGDNLDISSDIQFALDTFGPVDLKALADYDISQFSPTSRWKTYEQTHGGAYLGVTYDENPSKFEQASATLNVNEKSAPIMIIHDEVVSFVPYTQSVALLDAMRAGGKEASLYVIPGAGHGSDEFWQEPTRELSLRYYDKYLKSNR